MRDDGLPSDELIACKVIMLAKLPASAKAVAAALLDHFNWKSGRCDPSLTTLMEVTRCARSVVQEAIGQLVATGWLVVTVHGPRSSGRNHFSFQWDRLREAFVSSNPRMARKTGRDRPGKPGVGGPENRAQTLHSNPTDKPLGPEQVERRGVDNTLAALSAKPRHRQGRSGSAPSPQRFLTHAIPGGKGTPRATAAEAAAERRLDRAIRTHRPELIALIEPATHARALEAEIRARGSGLDVALDQLRVAIGDEGGGGSRSLQLKGAGPAG